MTAQCTIERQGTDGERANRFWRRPSWLRPEMLASLAELNEQYLDLLALQAMANASQHGFPLVQDLRPLLTALDPNARRRAAACPYLLADAGFADSQRWLWARGFHVREVERAPADQPYLAMPQTVALTRLVFTYAWHLARTHGNAARMLLGMSGRTAEILSTYTLRQLTDLAELHPHWLQPRWAAHPRMWRELLAEATKGEGVRLDHARMRGVQLLAAEAHSSALS